MNFEDTTDSSGEREALQQAIDAIEAQRQLLGDQTVETALAAIRDKLTRLNKGIRASQELQERKLITVLFADVSGFTAMAEAIDHEIVSSVINSLWSRVDKAIEDHGGRIDKHIGDAVMALFGTPTAREDDPERAIRAALQIQTEVHEWKWEFDDSTFSHRSPHQILQLRIGVNTGPALLGTVGTIGEYTAIGNTVNVASRLQQAAPLGSILISYDTYQHVRGIFDVAALQPITVKGKSEPIQVYTVNSIRPRAFHIPTRGVEGIETRTIGREEELVQMQAALTKVVEERQMHLINIVAEAGTGKSRLLYEFTKWLDLQKHSMHLFRGRARQEMAQIPYGLLRDIFSSGFEIQDHDSASTARQKLESGILSYIGNEKNASLYAHFIGHLIGLDYSTSPHLQGILGDAQQIHDRAFHYAAQFFADITGGQIAILFLEDIHWADDGSLDFFDHLMKTKPDLPLLLVGLTRSTLFETRPDWGTAPVQNLRIDLLPLSEDDSRRLVEEILQKVPHIPPALMDLIVSKAEGSPFYVEEVIKVLMDQNVIRRGEEQWQVEMERLSELSVPATLTGLLQARLDNLNSSARETLQQASVVGRIFWTSIVERMQNPEKPIEEVSTPIEHRLRPLRAKEFIFEYGDLTTSQFPEFIFKSAILHDVTYESVLLRLRRSYHLQAAEGLIGIWGERVNEYAGRVGEHYEQAGELRKAAEWYARAGRQAQATYEPNAAIQYYKKALEFLSSHMTPDEISLQLEIHAHLGEVLNWQARYTDAVETYEAMFQIATEDQDVIAQSQALQGIATSLSYRGQHKTALESAIHAGSLAERANARIELAKAIWTQGSARYRLGETRAALSLGEQALEIATQLNDSGEMARSLNLLGAAHYVLGQYAQAQNYWESALNIFQELNNRQQGMDLLSNLGVIADARGDYETAFQRYHNALEIAREIGYRDGEIVFLTNRGMEQVALGNYGAGEADLRHAIQLAGVNGSWCMPITYNYHAEALLGLDHDKEAYSSAKQALALAEEDKTPEYIGMAWRTLGMVSDKLGKPIRLRDPETHRFRNYDAGACFAKSESIFAEAEIDMERARTLREWAKAAYRNGDQEQAEKLWQDSRAIFTRLGADMEVERMAHPPA